MERILVMRPVIHFLAVLPIPKYDKVRRMSRQPELPSPILPRPGIATAIALAIGSLLALGCRQPAPPKSWTLAPDSAVKTDDGALLARIGQALDAAELAGPDPSISKFQVRTATVIAAGGANHVVSAATRNMPGPRPCTARSRS